MRRVIVRFLRESARTLLALAAYGGVLAGIGYGALVAHAWLPLAVESSLATAPSEWSETDRAAPAIALELADFLDAEPRRLVRRHVDGGGRRDLLTWGPPDGGKPAFAIELYRPGVEDGGSGDPLDAFAPEGVEPTASDPPMAVEAIRSKFGPFALVRRGGCLGFARTFEGTGMEISGLYCGREPDVRGRKLIACALDRLSLVSAGGDARLAGLFARASLKRSQCGPDRLPTAALPSPTEWLEESSAPGLRGSVVVR